MKCSFCDSVLQTVPQDGHCPHCDAMLRPVCRRNLDLKFPAAPVGKYRDAAGYIEITEDSVTFYRKQFFKAYIRTIPFCEIQGVSFSKGDLTCSGSLCVREWQDRQLPLLQSGSEVVFDATSVYFRQSQNKVFERLYLFLKQCADIVAAAQEKMQLPDDSELFGRYDGFYGFMELQQDSVAIFKKLPLCLPTQHIIPYSEIAQVAIKSAKGVRRGGLTVRRRNDGKNMRWALWAASADETSIDFTEVANEKMMRVYTFLADQVRENTN